MNSFDMIFTKLNNCQDISITEANQLAHMILDQTLSEDLILQCLSLLADKGESVNEIIGFINVVLQQSVFNSDLQIFRNNMLVDIVGTGGSGLDRFNVSTSAVFVAAACGVPIAKHGNKGSRKPNGSFDFLEALNIPIHYSPQQARTIFQEMKCIFLFTQNCHPKIGELAEIRKKLGKTSIFNKIGPFCNPAPISFQVLGISNPQELQFFSKIAQALERKCCLIVSGEPGIDEISISGCTSVCEINENREKFYMLTPADFNLQTLDYAKLPVGDAINNAEIFLALIDGKAPRAIQSMVAINAGAVLYVANAVSTLYDGYQLANTAIQSGKVQKFFKNYLEFVTKIVSA